jgi:DNA-binding PadR family transcriptional regulator
MAMKTSAYLVLGMLRLGAGTGYAIKKAADVSSRFFWTSSLAQIYPDLANLAKQGLVTRREDPRGARARSVYEVTPKGEDALLRWLKSSRERPPQYRDEGVLRLFFADALAPDEQRELIRRLVRRNRAAERRIREEIVPMAENLERDGLRFPAFIARLGADITGLMADRLVQLEQEVANHPFAG